MNDEIYREWLAERRALSPQPTLADETMQRVVELERQRQSIWWLCLVQRIERSRTGRWAVCGGAFILGSLPFVFLAFATQTAIF